MPRDPSAARARLQHAAVRLFAAQGYDATTAVQIAAEAGVTERTFFRHFPDKREVLFDGQEVLSRALSQAVTDAPSSLTPLQVLRTALLEVAPLIEDNRPFNEPRTRIIDSTPALKERELAKVDALTTDLVAAFQRRGLAETPATLVAGLGVTVLGQAVRLWLTRTPPNLVGHLDRVLRDVQVIS